MLGLFIDASRIMDELFWRQAYPGDRTKLLEGAGDARVRRFIELNYGPWDRLEGNAPFVQGVGVKPPGAGFYPLDMSREEFEQAELAGKQSEYTVLRRDAKGALQVVPYSREWREEGRRSGGGPGTRALPARARAGLPHRRLPRE